MQAHSVNFQRAYIRTDWGDRVRDQSTKSEKLLRLEQYDALGAVRSRVQLEVAASSYCPLWAEGFTCALFG